MEEVTCTKEEETRGGADEGRRGGGNEGARGGGEGGWGGRRGTADVCLGEDGELLPLETTKHTTSDSSPTGKLILSALRARRRGVSGPAAAMPTPSPWLPRSPCTEKQETAGASHDGSCVGGPLHCASWDDE